jgi:hypothetical protein
MQVWIETGSDDSGNVGVVIEDGRVKQMTSADNGGNIAVQPQ